MEDFWDWAIGIISGFFYVIWRLIRWIFLHIGKLIKDILLDVRKRTVKYIGGIIFLILLGYIIRHFTK